MNFAKALFLLFGAAALAACDSDNNNPNQQQDFFALQVLHGSPDAPPVNVLVDGVEVLGDVDYKDGSAALSLTTRDEPYSIRVDGILPGGDVAVIGPADIDFEADTTYSVIAVNDVANIEPLIISQPTTPVSAGNARLFVAHGAALAPEVDVYVTAPDADLAGSAPVGTFAFKGTIGPAEVAAGDYQIRVTPAGDSGTVVYDSGTVTLADGSDLTIAALPNTSGGPAPITLVALTGTGTLEIADINTPTSLQVVHASPDAPAVDVVVDGNVLVPNLPFPVATGFVEVPAATYNVAVTVAGNPGAVAIGPVDLPLEAGVRYSVLAVGPLAEIEPLILSDDPRRVATNAKVRIVHASPTAQDVDIYVTAVGADINNESPTLTSVPFKANTGYLNFAAGDYDVTVVPAGTKTAAIGPATISVEDGGIYTAIARDPIPGEMAFGLIVTDDFVAE